MNNNPTAKKPWPRLLSWAKKYRLSVSLVTGAVIIAGVFNFTLWEHSRNSKSDNNQQRALKPKPTKLYSSLTGLEVAEQAAITSPTTAVMIENSPDARPQSGLKSAGVVYEAVAEGGITRFLAIFQGDKPELIGPVRSLRYYYLNWAAPYQASIAHVGGSYNALEEVRNGHHRDIDQSFNSGAYWRASDRVAPHNVYTSGTKLDELNKAKEFNQSKFNGFARADNKPATDPVANNIQIGFSSPTYATSYSYNPEQNNYSRSLAGQPHNDREQGQLTPVVIIAIEVQTVSRGGSDGYQDIVTTGSGKATIFQSGTATEASWHKKGLFEPLEVLDSDNQPIKLNRGQTWVSAVTSTGSISWN